MSLYMNPAGASFNRRFVNTLFTAFASAKTREATVSRCARGDLTAAHRRQAAARPGPRRGGRAIRPQRRGRPDHPALAVSTDTG